MSRPATAAAATRLRALSQQFVQTAASHAPFASPYSSSAAAASTMASSAPASQLPKLLYPTSLKLDVQSLEGFAVSLHPYDVKKPIPEELADAEIIVTWQNSDDNLRDAAPRLKKLRWVQSLAAGPNDVLNAGFDVAPGTGGKGGSVVLTTGSGLHDHPVAEHALGLLLNAARRFFEMRDYQIRGEWPGHLGGAQPDRPADKFVTLRDANVLIWGYGNIAKALEPSLTVLGAKVRGVARRSGVRNGIEVYSEDKLPELLPQTDALVMILPGDPSTRHALNAERLRLLPKHAWVVNVGRGTSIDDDALVDALEQGRLGGAALDVFDPEPLPASSRLWKAPNTIISPHAAGGRPQGCEDLITYNLRRFLAGQELKNVI